MWQFRADTATCVTKKKLVPTFITGGAILFIKTRISNPIMKNLIYYETRSLRQSRLLRGVDENFFRGDRNFAYTHSQDMNLIFLESTDSPESVEPKII